MKKKGFGPVKHLEKRLLLDAAAVALIADAVITFDAGDIDGDGNITDGEGEVLLINHENEISIYPNPVRNYLNIEINSKIYLQIQILDIRGKRLSKHTLNNGKATIDVKKLRSGVYFLLIPDASGNALWRFRKK